MTQALLSETPDFLNFPFSPCLPFQQTFWPWVSEEPRSLTRGWKPLN